MCDGSEVKLFVARKALMLLNMLFLQLPWCHWMRPGKELTEIKFLSMGHLGRDAAELPRGILQGLGVVGAGTGAGVKDMGVISPTGPMIWSPPTNLTSVCPCSGESLPKVNLTLDMVTIPH